MNNKPVEFVNVSLRIRPVLSQNSTSSCLQVISKTPPVLLVVDRSQTYHFDKIFTEDVDQETVYNDTVKPLVEYVKKGFNCTVFAYGQTGTGKTYTMGTNSQDGNEKDIGIIPRTLDQFFQPNNNEGSYIETEITISFIEIYNEKVFDLLQDNNKPPLIIKGFKDFKQEVVLSRHDANKLLEMGNKNRHTAGTKQNSSSSRSHAVFTIYCKVRYENRQTCAKLNLVDLAGCESVRKTGNQGSTFQEGVNINKGLLCIGQVMTALSTNASFIPYRQSIITQILQVKKASVPLKVIHEPTVSENTTIESPKSLPFLGVSSISNGVDITQQNFSPVIRKYISSMESSLMNKLETVIKDTLKRATRSSLAREEGKNKENTPKTSWNYIQNEVTKLVRHEIVQLTGTASRAASSPIEDSDIDPHNIRRVLKYDSPILDVQSDKENSQDDTYIKEISVTKDEFKVPGEPVSHLKNKKVKTYPICITYRVCLACGQKKRYTKKDDLRCDKLKTNDYLSLGFDNKDQDNFSKGCNHCIGDNIRQNRRSSVRLAKKHGLKDGLHTVGTETIVALEKTPQRIAGSHVWHDSPATAHTKEIRGEIKGNDGFYTDDYENVSDDVRFKSKTKFEDKFWYGVQYLRLASSRSPTLALFEEKP
ncbi:hypothetical protein NQ317_010408 [Molorchus minor]|uniref:Kinesin motor domain-containing protein n=1 Tax=Molorchus minor TaxID=1323400 RepID=A0ABQ9JIC1_9CUCU|nr:hypothetical protein NQ317_010408 [Molorchus minor]